jgi:hypothetical protein
MLPIATMRQRQHKHRHDAREPYGQVTEMFEPETDRPVVGQAGPTSGSSPSSQPFVVPNRPSMRHREAGPSSPLARPVDGASGGKNNPGLPSGTGICASAPYEP